MLFYITDYKELSLVFNEEKLEVEIFDKNESLDLIDVTSKESMIQEVKEYLDKNFTTKRNEYVSINIYTCEICKKVFRQEDIMMNTITKKYACKFCVAKLELNNENEIN